MRSDSQAAGQKPRSFIEDARRAQIVTSAVETLAEHGYAGTSLARIATRVGISKGVISYHFAGKDELIEQLVEQIYGRISAFVAPEVKREQTVVRRLAARFRALANYASTHRAEMVALTEIFNNLRDSNGQLRYGDGYNEDLYQQLEEEFRAGQATGELRSFDTRVMAVTAQAAIDAMIAYSDTNPDHDIGAHASELALLFEHAIKAPTTAPPQET
ncbi:TetR family transcriptional regulator [Natronosporangium hydrolyticum]|uniref:TetR family transcriptional regulator n=1 Tax=Natronosporangium hydrolyticum TaxID=2811111 RepID=A0A895YEL6_9ACTN|nr:TetR/AcrR family transcriptional regulator [Natronosporangium hydrolyticum]QSB13849.1 TetR family transcriptional regulator [Natronosporangium hydrolyticum]